MKREQISLDSKDFLVALAFSFSKTKEPWTFMSLGLHLGLSTSRLHAATTRLKASGLLVGSDLRGKVATAAFREFIIHGAKYAFPAVVGAPVEGVLTGSSSPLFEPMMIAPLGQKELVWPSAKGKDRGAALVPLHPCVLKVIPRDPDLHRALVYFDALRTGLPREQEAAAAFFRKALA